MKIYEEPTIALILLTEEDLLTVSDPTGDDIFNDLVL